MVTLTLDFGDGNKIFAEGIDYSDAMDQLEKFIQELRCAYTDNEEAEK